MSKETDRLIEVMARLRDPESGCPWDLEQSFDTIAPYTIEEAYEVADAIAQGDRAQLKEELGDLLLQVVYHARMAEEEDAFVFEDVARAIADKMVRRHPHVFGDATVADAEAQTANWEAQKAAERARQAEADGVRPSALDGVPIGMPALTRAEKLTRRAARVGFDWPHVDQVFDKMAEEIAELRHEISVGAPRERLEDELGDLLFCMANLARHLKLDPEHALRAANAKFERCFRAVEASFAAAGQDIADATLETMEERWQRVKKAEG
jgi:nucleoside triphosphate diphosphatase